MAYNVLTKMRITNKILNLGDLRQYLRDRDLSIAEFNRFIFNTYRKKKIRQLLNSEIVGAAIFLYDYTVSDNFAEIFKLMSISGTLLKRVMKAYTGIERNCVSEISVADMKILCESLSSKERSMGVHFSEIVLTNEADIMMQNIIDAVNCEDNMYRKLTMVAGRENMARIETQVKLALKNALMRGVKWKE
jgi:hypothetical protein